MKFAALTIFLLFAGAAFARAQETYYGTDDVVRFRAGRDRDFRDRNLTPLLAEDFAKFKGLEYFAVDEKYVVKAKFERTADAKTLTIPTSVGTSRKFYKYGVLIFELNGARHSLTVFQSETAKKDEYKNLLFVPFRDHTNGGETYGAGRYLDINKPADDAAAAAVTINFNLAYNPNCAYGSDEFSCPLPPKENFLQTAIKAGEKAYPFTVRKQ